MFVTVGHWVVCSAGTTVDLMVETLVGSMVVVKGRKTVENWVAKMADLTVERMVDVMVVLSVAWLVVLWVDSTVASLVVRKVPRKAEH